MQHALHSCIVCYMNTERLTVAEAEQMALDWATNNARRDQMVRAVKAAGLSKLRIHKLTGIARTTIDRILEETAMSAVTDITITLDRPADEYASGWNWAEAATDQWIAAAEAIGLPIDAVSDEVDRPDSDAAVIKVANKEYVLKVRQDEVRAVPADEA